MVNLNDKDGIEPEETAEFTPPEDVASNDKATPPKSIDSQDPNENTPEPAKESKKPRNKFKAILKAYWPKKKWTIPVSVVVLIGLVLAVPMTRYGVLGLFLKDSVSVQVVDSKTGKPVSSAVVRLHGTSLKTDGNGLAKGKIKLGGTDLDVSKQYYTAASKAVTVTMSKAHNNFRIALVATGRQVPISVTNKITGQPLAGAVIKVLTTDAKTSKAGAATIVLPTTTATQKATISLDGYNVLTTTVTITDQQVTSNSFALTPSGKIFFLSNQTGKIDVIKANLDGSDRQTVLAGTGSEDSNNTSLLASRDWKYLALLSKRSGASASVYLIDTTTGKLTTMDEGNAEFSLIGWSDDTFVYQVNRNGVQQWQPKAQALKSYNATTGKLTTIDETQGEGSSSYDYGFTNFSNVYILNNELLYAQNWYSSYYTNHLNGKNVALTSVKPDGTAKKTVKDFSIPNGSQYFYVSLSLYEPAGVYVQVPNGDSQSYYEYEDGSLSAKPDVTNQAFSEGYPTYLLSPSGKQTVWSDQRDGKNTLFTGDPDAKNEKQIASLSEYTQYGWYTDNYILVSKNSSELYILPASGSASPYKVTDYYKPAVNYRGYGGGYGGL